jgi:predicted AlkP superfamily pyrophosphatase or phosphodiesterase
MRFSYFAILPLLFSTLLWHPGQARALPGEKSHEETPKLVVGIVVDQLRPDYIYRFWDNFEDGGFKRLVNGGHTFRNAWFSYMQTSTGPGHAAQLTGATPSIHGLIGNSFYIRGLDRNINVIEDVGSGHRGVGSLPDYRGEKSPANMLVTTVGDELYLHTNRRSKTIGISRKDRGAILPAGHTGKAFWYEGATGNFITSTFYMDELPGWLQEFNNRNLAREYLTRTWDMLLPEEEYAKRSRPDDNPYEGTFRGMDRPAFPIDLAYLSQNEGVGPGDLARTPFSDEHLTELAMAAIEGEQLGRRGVPDILAISYSATDAVGHRFGPASYQMQDMIIRLDRYLARLLDYLDEQIGMEHVLVYLTSDHGGAYIPHYLRDLGIITGNTDNETHIGRELNNALSTYMEETYGENFILNFSNQNIYLDHAYMKNNGLDPREVRTNLKRFLLTLDMVGGALTADALNYSEFTQGIRGRAQNMFHQKRSGDVLVWLQPQTRGNTGTGGTGHGTPWAYDTKAPLILYGYDVPAGQATETVYVRDIASTVAIYLNAPFPSGNVGEPLQHRMNRSR